MRDNFWARYDIMTLYWDFILPLLYCCCVVFVLLYYLQFEPVLRYDIITLYYTSHTVALPVIWTRHRIRHYDNVLCQTYCNLNQAYDTRLWHCAVPAILLYYLQLEPSLGYDIMTLYCASYTVVLPVIWTRLRIQHYALYCASHTVVLPAIWTRLRIRVYDTVLCQPYCNLNQAYYTTLWHCIVPAILQFETGLG